MFRKDHIGLLQHHPATLRGLSEMLDEPIKDVDADRQHLQRSLHHEPWQAVIPHPLQGDLDKPTADRY